VIRFGAAVCALAGLAACGRAPQERPATLVEQARVAMGSELRLTAWTGDLEAADAAFAAVFAEFDRLEALLSTWREGSDVQRLNAAAGTAPIAVARETIEILTLARQIGDLTHGKFDITFGALADIWRFDHDQDNRVPSAEAIQARLGLVDYRAVDVDAAARTAAIAGRGVRIHLGGIGKGYAIDRAAALLRGYELRDFMIQAGGDLYVAGRRGDRPWRLGIQDPRGAAGSIFANIELADRTLSTSGDYERFFIANGRRYHHILDPDSGEPAMGCRSVSIVAPRAVMADGLSTGVFVLGPREGMALIERLPDVEGVIVTADNGVLVSTGLRDRLTIVAPPTE
jgi:thiamine biosynthesis lipoprotein